MSLRSENQAATRGRTLGVGLSILVLAVVGATVVRPLLHSRTARPDDLPAAMVDGGKSVAFVALVPWHNAVVSPDGRRVRVDVDRADLPANVHACTVAAVRAGADEDGGGRVRIAVAGYGPQGDGRACTAVGLLPDHLWLDLTTPLGARRLVDRADERVRPSVSESAIPSVAAVGPGFVVNSVGWDEQTGVMTRVYLSRARYQSDADAVQLDYGRAPTPWRDRRGEATPAG